MGLISNSLPSSVPASGNLSPSVVWQSSTTAPMVVAVNAGSLTGTNISVDAGPVNAHASYDPEKHDPTYLWSVRENNLTLERAANLNMPDEWKNPNLRYGKEVVFVFDAPGVYTLDLEAADQSGNSDTAGSPLTFTVVDPDDTYSGSSTIVVSDDASFTGAPSGATQINLSSDTWADLQTAIDNRGNTLTRVLFKAGVDFRGNGQSVNDRLDFSGIFSSDALVGSFGSGAKPILYLCKATSANDDFIGLAASHSGQCHITDIDMRGNYDPAAEQGWQGGNPTDLNTTCDIMFHRCRVSGAAIITTQFRNGDCYFVWSDGEVTDWMDMGIFGHASAGGTKYIAIIGSDIHQNSASRDNTYGKRGVNNQHGPVRIEEPYGLYLHMLDLFSNCGWTSVDQAALRLNTNGVIGANVVGDRLTLEGGWRCVNCASENSAASDPPSNYIFDKIITIGNTKTANGHIDNDHGGWTLRNVLSVEYDFDKVGSDLPEIYKNDPDNTDYSENLTTPIKIYNTTSVALASANGNVQLVTNNGFTELEEANNVLSAPNQPAPVVTHTVDITSGLAGGRSGVSVVTPRYEGPAPSVEHIIVTSNGTNSFSIPYTTLVDKDGSATSQSFWNARVAAGSVNHVVSDNGADERFFADLGEFSVSFGASSATITKTTGTWNGASDDLIVRLDQSDDLDPPNSTYDLTGQMVYEARRTASADVAANSLYAATDILCNARAGSGLTGASAGTPQRGAFEANAA